MRALVVGICAGTLLALGPDWEDERTARAAHHCRTPGGAAAPQWAKRHKLTVLVDSVLLGGAPTLRASMGCWRVRWRGRPALMVKTAARELRRRGRRVAPLVVVGLGYNSLWERHRRRYRFWARRFDRAAGRLRRSLHDLGARQLVWVTLREPTRRTVPASAIGELGQYSWYFRYVNERLRRLDRKRDDVVLADWASASRRRGLTYDSIHLNPRGARLMARTIRKAIQRQARRQAASGR